MQNVLELINEIIIQWKESSSQYQMELTKMNSCMNSIQLYQQNYCNSNQMYKPLNKSNILMALQESFELQDCDRIIKQAANDNNDDKCIQLMNQGFFYPKMLTYLAEKFFVQFILYNQRKKKYFRFGLNTQTKKYFLFQKNSQIFNILHKKNSNKQQQLIKSQDSSRQNPKTIFSKGFKLNQSEKKSNSKCLFLQNLPKIQASVQKSIHKEIANQMHQIQDKLIEQILNSLKKVSFSTPKRNNQIQLNNNFQSEIEYTNSDEEIIYQCGGKFTS